MRRMHRAALAAALVTTAGGLAGTPTANAAEISSQTLTYTGAAQSIPVPSNATEMSVQMTGGSGGNGWNATTGPVGKPAGGHGATVTGWTSVKPGSTLTAYVGGAGQSSLTNPRKIVTGPTAGGWGYTSGGAGGATIFGLGDEARWGQGGGGGGSSALTSGDSVIALAAGGGGGGGGDDGDTGHSGGAGGDAGAVPQDGADGQNPGHGGAAASIPSGVGGDSSTVVGSGPGAGGGGGAPATNGSGGGGAGGENGESYPDFDGGGGGGGAGSSSANALTLGATTTANTAGNGSITVTFYTDTSACQPGAAMVVDARTASSSFNLPALCNGVPASNWQLVSQPPRGTATVWKLVSGTGAGVVYAPPTYTGQADAVFKATTVFGQTQTFHVTFLIGAPGFRVADQATGLVMDSSGSPIAGATPNGSTAQSWSFTNNPNGTVALTSGSGCLVAPNPAAGNSLSLGSCAQAAPLNATINGSGMTLSLPYQGLSLGLGPASSGSPLQLTQSSGSVWQLQAPSTGTLGARRSQPIRIGWVKVGHHRVRMPLGRTSGNVLRLLLDAPAGNHISYRKHGAWHPVRNHHTVTVTAGMHFRVERP